MSDNKVAIKPSTTNVSPTPTTVVQVSINTRWNNNNVGSTANKAPAPSNECVKQEQVSLNERWRNDCVG